MVSIVGQSTREKGGMGAGAREAYTKKQEIGIHKCACILEG